MALLVMLFALAGGQCGDQTRGCATGVEWRRLGLPNEQQLPGASLYYRAGLSEAPLCHNEHVVVIGGGNSAGQAVMHF
jgi:thioredoxin reductase (NADPH)